MNEHIKKLAREQTDPSKNTRLKKEIPTEAPTANEAIKAVNKILAEAGVK